MVEREARLAQLQTQTGRLAEQQLPGLIQEMASLQVSTVLHGDYSLKIARQDYFTSKQDRVHFLCGVCVFLVTCVYVYEGPK